VKLLSPLSRSTREFLAPTLTFARAALGIVFSFEGTRTRPADTQLCRVDEADQAQATGKCERLTHMLALTLVDRALRSRSCLRSLASMSILTICYESPEWLNARIALLPPIESDDLPALIKFHRKASAEISFNRRNRALYGLINLTVFQPQHSDGLGSP
jgi:hypothetical protein